MSSSITDTCSAIVQGADDKMRWVNLAEVITLVGDET